MGNTLFKHIFFEEIDSTSSYLIKEHNNLENFTFVSTNYQSKGKGRENRQWISVKGTNLLFSFLIKNKDLIREYASISLFCAAKLAEFLISLGIDGVQIKWPNDVYIKGKKVAGILLEGNVNEYIVIGIGLNVNQDFFPNNLHHPATSIYLESGKKFNLEFLKEKLFKHFYEQLNLQNIWERHYLKLIKDLDFLKGKTIFVTHNNHKICVKAVGISDENSLIVEYNNERINIISGEVEFE